MMQIFGLAFELDSHPKYSQWPQYWQAPSVNPSEFTYAALLLDDGVGKGCMPALRAASLKIRPACDMISGLLGYSFWRGPSNGLPPSWIWPRKLPALPDVPQSFSKRSKYGSSSSYLTPKSWTVRSAGIALAP